MSKGYGKTQKAILDYMLYRDDEDCSECVTYIAKDIGATQPATSRAIKRLEADGLLIGFTQWMEDPAYRIKRKRKCYYHVENAEVRQQWRNDRAARLLAERAEARKQGVSVMELRFQGFADAFRQIKG